MLRIYDVALKALEAMRPSVAAIEMREHIERGARSVAGAIVVGPIDDVRLLVQVGADE